MKKIKFTCSSCGAKLRVPSHLAGVTAPCPKCGEKITAPNEFDETEDDTAAIEAPAPSQAQPAYPGAVPSSSSPVEQPSSTVVAAPPEPYSPPVPTVAQPSQTIAATQPTVSASVSASPPRPAPETSAESPQPAAPHETAAAAPESTVPVASPAQDMAPEPEPVVAPEPVVEKTQPIRVNPQPRHLPGIRNEFPEEESLELPRLDTSLAESNGAAAPRDVPREPTRVQLPAPGGYSNQVSPDDFIVPNAEPAADPVPEVPVQEQAAPELAPLDLPGVPQIPEPLPQQPEAVATPETEMSVSEMLGLDGFEPETASAAPAPAESSDYYAQAAAAAEAEVPETRDYHDPAHPDYAPDPVAPAEPVLPVPLTMPAPNGVPPQEAIHANGLAEPSSEAYHAYEQPADHAPQYPAEEYYEEPAPTQPVAAISAPAQSEPTNPIAASTNASPAVIPEPSPGVPEKSDADVLDDMFGSGDSGKKGGMGVMLLIIACVAVIATIVVVAIFNAAGGFSVDHPGSDRISSSATPPPAVEPEKPDLVLNAGSETPGIDDAPAIIDPPALQREPDQSLGQRSTVTLPGDTENPVRIIDSSANGISEAAESTAASLDSASDSVASSLNNMAEKAESEALSFDERVQQIVNGGSAPGAGDAGGMSVIGGAPAQNLVDGAGDVTSQFGSALTDIAEETQSVLNSVGETASAAASGINYNPAPAYPAPRGDDDLTDNTHAVIDAFLRAPDWRTRINYTYNGESLRPAIEEYYQRWPDARVDRFSTQLFQMEADPEMGGPYWVYLVSTSDMDQGFPLIIREENGNLKVDWEIFAEFQDRHFVRFREGSMGGTSTFRLVIERMSDYYGSDRDGFKDLDDHFVYQINPPYGDLNEFSEYAFVKKGTPIASKLDEVVGLGDEPLAVIITLKEESFSHGIKHFVISDYVTEGWFISE